MESGEETQAGIGDPGSGIPEADAGAGTVEPHAANVVAWDIPSAIVAGEKFRMKVGVKCPHECALSNHDFGIYDEEGAELAAGTLPGDRWTGTTGLHVAEIELEAPAAEGLYTWSATAPRRCSGQAPGPDVEIPHAEGSVSFGVRVVSHPEYVVTVETVDGDSHAPLDGARVVMHPYKAVTDERGIARVRVAKGAYRLFVSQPRYLTFGLPVEVTADMTTRAELYVEPVTERN